jgi:hypothetical protein
MPLIFILNFDRFLQNLLLTDSIFYIFLLLRFGYMLVRVVSLFNRCNCQKENLWLIRVFGYIIWFNNIDHQFRLNEIVIFQFFSVGFVCFRVVHDVKYVQFGCRNAK